MQKQCCRIHDADRLRPVLIAVVLVSSLLAAHTAMAVPGKLNSGDLDRIVPGLMEQADIPGMSIVVLKGGRVNFVGNYGVADRSTGKAVSEDTAFFAASLSKPMFAYAVLRMAQRGEISLDKPLCEYLPYKRLEHDARYRSITARMVLSHSSGMPNWSETPRMELSFSPGSGFEYSGEGFVYLQKVVEKLSGMDLNAFMDREVFKPLKMQNSAFYARADLQDRMANGHDLLGKPTRRPQPTRSSMNPAGTLITTGADYGRFMEGFLQLTDKDAKLGGSMCTAQSRPEGFFGGENRLPIYWGLGFGLEANASGNTVWQWGDNLDFRNFVMANPQLGDGVVMLSNSENGMSVARRICGLVLEGQHPAFDWLPFAEFDDPRFVARHRIEKDIVDNGARNLPSLYADADRKLDREQLNELVVSIGMQLVRRGRPSDAFGLLELHASRHDRDPDAYDMLASFHLSRGDSNRALEALQKSADLDPDNAARNRQISMLKRQM